MSDVVVCGYAVRFPLVGSVLAFAHYVIGLHRLGHRVVYLEESGWEDSCYDPASRRYGPDPRAGLDLLADTLNRMGGHGIPIGYLDRDSGRSYGLTARQRRQHLAGADLLINVGGVCSLDEFASCQRRVLIDLDPGFTQVGLFGGSAVADHHVHLTYGTNIRSPDCLIPDDGVSWQPTVPPVVVDRWWEGEVDPADGDDRAEVSLDRPMLSTVANLDAYGEIEVAGRTYGQKRPEVERLGRLPARLAADRGLGLVLAISSNSTSMTDGLTGAGWRVTDGETITGTFDGYTAFIGGSTAEFSVAKEAYVGLRTGWFSDRSVCYLAAGRPVIVQDTGFVAPIGSTGENGAPFPDRREPLGGVLTWTNAAEATENIARVVDDPRPYREAARATASEVFGHRPVLDRVLELAR